VDVILLEREMYSEGAAADLLQVAPFGKLDSERMVPLDDETLALIDRITQIRSPGRPLRHPRYARPAQFLFTHHGRRVSQNALREELDRAAQAAGLGHIASHQLRHA
jgi:site-specific recombinase XerD